MKNLLLNLAAVLMMAVTCFGCDDDDEEQIFQGIDNRIGSFVLTSADGGVYRAAIIDDEILVQVPDNVSLDGASVSYEISEQAVLYPDPAKMSDWDNEHRFRVMAYDRKLRDYSYRVVKVSVSTGSVHLLTQADVDAFAESGASVIDGNLVIGDYTFAGGDSITDLSGLAGITDVRYNIIVNNSFGGGLIELPALRSAGGLVMGTPMTTLETADTLQLSLPVLESMGQFTARCNTLSRVSMPQLKTVSNFRLDAALLDRLELGALAECAGDLSIVCGTSTSNSNKFLTAFSFPSLEKVKGSLEFRFFAKVERLELPRLAVVGGNCSFQQLPVLKSLDLPQLEYTGGKFDWNYLTKVTTFSAPKLASAAGFSIMDNVNGAMLATVNLAALENVYGPFRIQTRYSGEILSFPALKRVDGQFRLQNFASLLDLQIPQLVHCASIYFYTLNQLESLDLSNCGTIENIELIACYKLAELKVGPETLKNLELNGGSRFCDFTRIVGTDRIEGVLEVTNYSQNEELAFPGLKHIGTYKQTNGITGKQTLSFPDLETMDNLQMTNCGFLKRLDAPSLKEVKVWNTRFMQYVNVGDLNLPLLRKIGEFTFEGGNGSWNWNNMQLVSMDDFAGVEEIGRVKINGWGKMTDFKGMQKALPSIPEDGWTVTNCKYNPTYEDMKAGRFAE